MNHSVSDKAELAYKASCRTADSICSYLRLPIGESAWNQILNEVCSAITGVTFELEDSDKTLLIQRNQLRYYLATMMERKAHPFEEAEQVAIKKLLEETKG